MSEKWFVYILECANGSFYIGISQHVQRRLEYHQCGKGSLHAKLYRPIRLLWTEEHLNLLSARNRESQLKRWTRRKKWALIQRDMELLKML